MTLRRAPLRIAARCSAGSSVPCKRWISAVMPVRRSAVRSISATPGRKARTSPSASLANARLIAAAISSSIRASVFRPMWRNVSGHDRPSLVITGAFISVAKRLPSSVADIAISRKSGRNPVCTSNANARPKSLSRLRSCTSSNSTADTPASSGSSCIRLRKIPSVSTRTRVAADCLLSMRVAYPIVCPTGSPAISAIRSAAARAANRRGESSNICPSHQGSSSNAGATIVVLPAPGGATSTALGTLRSATFKSSKTDSMGSVTPP